MRTLIIIICFLTIQCSVREKEQTDTQSTEQQFTNYTDFSLKESRDIHKRFIEGNWGETMAEWARQGNDSRYIFLNYDEFFSSSVIKCNSGDKKELPIRLNSEISDFIIELDSGKIALKEYVKSAPVDGLIVLHKGEILFEDYPRMLPSDKHLWMSVTKTILSTAVAILEDRGLVESENTIGTYLHELSGSGWEDIKIRNVLDMASGIDCPVDFESNNNCWAQAIINYGIFNFNQPMENPLEYWKTIQFNKDQGLEFEYSDVNTLLLTILVEKMTDERFIKFVEREIWQKIGAGNDAIFQNGGFGRAATPLGMNSTLRDLARYGLAFTPSGRENSNALISDKYLKNIQKNLNDSLKTKSWFSDEEKFNSYQWDEVYDNGDFYKHGYMGQGLYVSPSKDLVIAFFGTAGKDRVEHRLPAISRELAKSDIIRN